MLLVNKTNNIDKTVIIKGLKILIEIKKEEVPIKVIYAKNKNIFYNIKDYIDTLIFLYIVNKIYIVNKENDIYVGRVKV